MFTWNLCVKWWFDLRCNIRCVYVACSPNQFKVTFKSKKVKSVRLFENYFLKWGLWNFYSTVATVTTNSTINSHDIISQNSLWIPLYSVCLSVFGCAQNIAYSHFKAIKQTVKGVCVCMCVWLHECKMMPKLQQSWSDCKHTHTHTLTCVEVRQIDFMARWVTAAVCSRNSPRRKHRPLPGVLENSQWKQFGLSLLGFCRKMVDL